MEEENKVIKVKLCNLDLEIERESTKATGSVMDIFRLKDKADSDDFKIIKYFSEGYQVVINAIKQIVDHIERETGLSGIQVSVHCMMEFLCSEINLHHPSQVLNEIENQLMPILESEESNMIESYHGYHEYYADQLISELALWSPEPERGPYHGFYEHVLKPIDKHLEKFLDDKLIGKACPEKSPGSTLFREILSECCRLHYRYLNDGDSGFVPGDPIFNDHVNLVELIRNMSESNYTKFKDALMDLILNYKSENGNSIGNILYHGFAPNLDEQRDFGLEYFCEEYCAPGASIIWSALIYAAQKELIQKGLATEDTPILDLDYSKVEFLNTENKMNCRGPIIYSNYK